MEQEILSFIKSLKGQDDEEISAVLISTFDFRNKILKLLEIDLMDPIISAQMLPNIRIIIHKFINELQSQKDFFSASGAMVWLHSMRAIEIPEIRIHGKEMWAELHRGTYHVTSQLQYIEQFCGRKIDVSGFEFFPIGLAPKNQL